MKKTQNIPNKFSAIFDYGLDRLDAEEFNQFKAFAFGAMSITLESECKYGIAGTYDTLLKELLRRMYQNQYNQIEQDQYVQHYDAIYRLIKAGKTTYVVADESKEWDNQLAFFLQNHFEYTNHDTGFTADLTEPKTAYFKTILK